MSETQKSGNGMGPWLDKIHVQSIGARSGSRKSEPEQNQETNSMKPNQLILAAVAGMLFIFPRLGR